jgi:hypothetical protein
VAKLLVDFIVFLPLPVSRLTEPEFDIPCKLFQATMTARGEAQLLKVCAKTDEVGMGLFYRRIRKAADIPFMGRTKTRSAAALPAL